MAEKCIHCEVTSGSGIIECTEGVDCEQCDGTGINDIHGWNKWACPVCSGTGCALAEDYECADLYK